MKWVLPLLLLATACLAVPNDLKHHWKLFKTKFNKVYAHHEDQRRHSIFHKNLRDIVHHNFKYDLGLTSYFKGLNRFTDMTPEEIKNKFMGLRIPSVRQPDDYAEFSNVMELPESVDWRKKGAVTGVKDQSECGSCWAFSTTGTLEGQHFLKTGKLVSLSEQQLVDCARPWGPDGCGGGWPKNALKYVKDNHGIDTEESYPYDANDEECKDMNGTVGATCTGVKTIKKGSETDLQKAVATIGPISIAINAEDFPLYGGGIIDNDNCTNAIYYLNHAILLVGYGTEKGKDFWLVKNSWGTSWGEDGYGRMARNKNNMCGIATAAVYPLV